MRKTYSEFCSRHTKALKLYKELYARDKRFQQFIRVSKPLQDPYSGPPHSWGGAYMLHPLGGQAFTNPCGPICWWSLPTMTPHSSSRASAVHHFVWLVVTVNLWPGHTRFPDAVT